jgi:hypothetical protein
MVSDCCQVCNGTGLIPNGFSTQTICCWNTLSLIAEMCMSCKGTGIVWSNTDI